MSTFDPSMKPMLEAFIYETSTILELLDEIMLKAEKDKALNSDEINEIFRFMHTIKGSSAMMGIDSISLLAHAVEDIFYILREEPVKLDLINEAIFDIIFQSSDYFKEEVEEIQNNDDFTPQDPQPIIAQLKEQVAIMNGGEAPIIPPVETPSEDSANPSETPKEDSVAVDGVSEDDSEEETFQVLVHFSEDSQMENLRAFMLYTQAKELCEFIESVPANPEQDPTAAETIARDGFLVKFRPSENSTPHDIYEVFDASVNVKGFDVLESYRPSEVNKAAKAEAAKVEEAAKAEAAKKTSDSASPDATAEQAKGPAAAAAAAPKKQSLISVNQAKLDQLMDLVGELVTTESMVESNPDLKGLELENFYKSTRELRKLTGELQDVVMSMRMMPLSGVFQKMARIVRDTSKKLGRKVELVAIGGETEMDKTINDAISDPFMHMVRNSVDHAIEDVDDRIKLGKPETGTITMSAQNIGGEIVITIADDGRGLMKENILKKARENDILTKPESEYSDKEIYGLIMLPGFSTKEVVTEFSGRGVGMDVVRKNIEKIGGTISVDSMQGIGTTFTIKIPLTLVIVEGMEISVGSTIFILPITSIKQTQRLIDKDQIVYNTDGSEMIMLRGECLPIIRLHSLYEIESKVTDLGEGILIQIESGDKAACLFVDELLGEQQVVVKPFPTYFNSNDIKDCGVSGCTILGDGSISLVLDASNIISCQENTVASASVKM